MFTEHLGFPTHMPLAKKALPSGSNVITVLKLARRILLKSSNRFVHEAEELNLEDHPTQIHLVSG